MKHSNRSPHDTLAMFTFNPLLSSLACDHYHHFYHYQSSAQYLWLAETLRALGLKDEMAVAYDKAIFQDHLNQEAIEGKINIMRGAQTPTYDSHFLNDREFCENIHRDVSNATSLHDEGIALFLAGDFGNALMCFDKAIAADASHSNSYYARGKIGFLKQDYTKARVDFEEAIRCSHQDHEAYHSFASGEHLARGLKFLADNEYDLAITCCTKALDLDHKNKEALKTRAEMYRAKGSHQLAEWDEIDLKKL